MTESMGYKANLAINSSSSFASGSLYMRYLKNTLAVNIPVEQNESTRGTRSRYAIDTAQGNIAVAGTLEMEPNSIEISRILTYMGFSVSIGTYTLTDTLTDLYVITDMVSQLHKYRMRINKATFSSQPGKKLKLALDLVGYTLTVDTIEADFPVVTADSTLRPYMMYDLYSGITIDSTSYDIDDFSLEIDNHIEPTYMSGQTATDMEPTDRTVMLKVQSRFSTTETPILANAISGHNSSASFAFTNQANIAYSLTFAIGSMVATAKSPSVERAKKIRLPMEYQCYATSGGASEVVITLTT